MSERSMAWLAGWAAVISIGAAGCASAPKRLAEASGTSGAALLDCVRRVSGELGYTALEPSSRARFRRVDAQGNDAQWYVADNPMSRKAVLIAETWQNSAGTPSLYVTIYQTDLRGVIVAVEPGPEKNRRLGGFFQVSARNDPTPLAPSVREDLAQIRESCPAPVG